MKATLYGVSVGPGDPELLTIKAVNVLRACQVIAAPVTSGEKTLALQIAQSAVDFSGKTVVKIPFIMSKDPQVLQKSHQDAADLVIEQLQSGRDVAMLNLGDVSIYSTFGHIMQLVKQAGFAVQMVAGVPSFCAVAAKLSVSLTSMDKPLHIIPAVHADLNECMQWPGTKVLMKTGSKMPQVRAFLKNHGMDASLVQNCGLESERICTDIEQADDSIGYFTTIVVKQEG